MQIDFLAIFHFTDSWSTLVLNDALVNLYESNTVDTKKKRNTSIISTFYALPSLIVHALCTLVLFLKNAFNDVS